MRIFPGFQHGVNLGGWLSQCVATTDAHFNTFIVEADIEQIAAMGFDHVRLPVDYNWIEDEAGIVHLVLVLTFLNSYESKLISTL